MGDGSNLAADTMTATRNGTDVAERLDRVWEATLNTHVGAAQEWGVNGGRIGGKHMFLGRGRPEEATTEPAEVLDVSLGPEIPIRRPPVPHTIPIVEESDEHGVVHCHVLAWQPFARCEVHT